MKAITQKQVLDEYNKRKSMRATAKVLIGYGVLDSPLIRRIAELRAAGMPQNDVADLLNISPATVNANTPYSRGTYLSATKSANAMKIKKWREKRNETL